MRDIKNRFNYALFTIIILFLPSLPSVFADIRINEIMYNPSGSDSGHEWLEIYNNGTGSINLEGWKFYESNVNHGLTLIQGNDTLSPDDYAVIADESSTFLADYPGFNGTLIDSSWSSLSNSGEYIAVKNNSDIIDEVNYTTELANGNGRSLERFSYGWNESSATGGSPGEQNNASVAQETGDTGLKLTVYIDDTAYVSTTYTSLFKIENLDHVSGITDHINLTFKYNITFNNGLISQDTVYITDLNYYKTSNTGSFTPTSAGNYTITGWIINSTVNDSNSNDDSDSKIITVIDTTSLPCNITINITTDKETYSEGESIKFYNNINNKTFPFTIEYWIGDFFSNIYKNKYNTTNTNQKSWKTSITEQDRVLFIKSIVYPNCNDSNTSDNSAEKMFIVTANDSIEINEESSLEIIEVDDKAKFGDIVDVKVEIYKGNTGKYSISLWAEDKSEKISETTKIHLYDKYSSYNGQLPIQLDPNCNQEFDDGKYDVVIKGLDQEDKKEIKIGGIKTSSCQKTSSTTTSSSTESKTSSSKKFEYNIIEIPDKITGNKIKTKVQLSNNDDDDYDIKIWGYLYRGSKCYSGEREANKKEILLQAGTSETINLENRIIEAAPGDYKYKVVINKDNQKTNKEIIEDIVIEAKQAVKKEQLVVAGKAADKDPEETQDKITSNTPYKLKLQSKTVYESVDEKIKKLTFTFLITLSIFLNIALVWRR